MWSTAVPDWQDRILSGRSLMPELPLFKSEADIGLALFNEMRVTDAIGLPKMGDAAAPWFKEIVRAFFGSVNPATRERMIRTFFVMVPKKNGKSIYSAGLMLTALLMNNRPNATFVIAAPSREAAANSFQKAGQMAQASPELVERFQVRWHDDSIFDRSNGSELRIKTFDQNIVTGSFPAGVLIDEEWLLGKMEKAERVMGQLHGGMLPDPSSFVFIITTQSDQPPAGVFKADLEIARGVRDGKIQRPLLPILYEFPQAIGETDEWRAPEHWHLVNPNAGKSISTPRLEELWEDAKLKGDAKIREWASQHLNIEMGIGLRTDAWKGAKYWLQQTRKALTLDALLERSEVVVVGVDDGGLDDLLGCCVLGRDAGDPKTGEGRGDWLCWSHGWAHPQVLEDRKSIATILRDAEAAGELTISDDRLAHFEEVAALAARIRELGLLAAVAVDPATMQALLSVFADEDITLQDGTLKPVKQGWGLMQAIKGSEVQLSAGTLWHSGSALMNWCVTNLKIEPTATAIRPVKISAGDKKIDLAIAMFNAVTIMATNPQKLARAEAAAMIA